MDEVLEEFSFDVRHVGTREGGASPRRSDILVELQQAVATSLHGDLLLIYLSGHGLSVGDADYFMPMDALATSDRSIQDTGIEIDPSALLRDCAASYVLLIIDACRQHAPSAKGRRLVGRGIARARAARIPPTALVYSCHPDELSYFGSDGSFFTLSLVAALRDERVDASLDGIVAGANEVLEGLARENGQKQRLRVNKGEQGPVDELGPLLLVERPVSPVVQPYADWAAVVLNSESWNHVRGEDLQYVEDARSWAVDQTRRLANWCSPVVDASPWYDRKYAERAIRMTDLLLRLMHDSHGSVHDAHKWTILDVVAVVLTPVAYAAAHAMAMEALESGGDDSELNAQFTRFVRLNPRRSGAFSDAAKRGDPHQARFRKWCLARWASSDPELWSAGGWCQQQLVTAIEPWRGLTDVRVPTLAGCMVAQPVRLMADGGEQLYAAKEELDASRALSLHTRTAAHFVALAGGMAIGMGSLDDAIGEHLGSGDPVVPEVLLNELADARWRAGPGSRRLGLTCSHHVVDRSIDRHVQTTNALLSCCHARATEPGNQMRAFANLPLRLETDIAPKTGDTGPVFQRPHLEFRLHDDKVRDLLMGERLYGKPELALRELYQNALDACRLAKARRAARVQDGATLGDWTGRIEFVQGRTASGRAFVDCRDNGAGMDQRTLVECFATAGNRFVDTAEFREESARWDTLPDKVELHANSQFGIGVFSYFMLADEIEVQTRSIDASGPGLTATIAGGARIFRVRPATGEASHGTRIRLFLRPEFSEGNEAVKSVRTLRNHVWVSEFEMLARDGSEHQSWNPGELVVPEPQPAPSFSQFASFSWSIHGGALTSLRFPGAAPGVWWLRDKPGQLLVDGVRTSATLRHLVVDLRGPHRPHLTVDRKDVVDLRTHRGHLNTMILSSTAAFSTPPEWLDLEWLWSVAQSRPGAAQRIVEELSESGIALPLRWSPEPQQKSGQRELYRVRDVGCFPLDSEAIKCLDKGKVVRVKGVPSPLLALRAATIRNAATVGPLSMPDVPTGPSVRAWQGGLSEFYRAFYADGRFSWRRVVQIAAERRRRLDAFVRDVSDSLCLLFDHDLRCPSPPRVRLDRDDAIIADPTDPAWSVLLYSARTNVPLAEASRRARVLTAFIREAEGRPTREFPELDDPIANLVVRPLDISALKEDSGTSAVSPNQSVARRGRRKRSNPRRMKPGLVGPCHVIVVAIRQGRSPQEVASSIELYGDLLEVEVPKLNWPELDDLAPEFDPVLLSRRLDGCAPWLTGKVSPGHLLRAAGASKLSVAEVINRLARYAEAASLQLPTFEELDLPCSSPTAEDVLMLSRHLDGTAPWVAGLVHPGHVFGAASRLGQPVQRVLARLSDYATALRLQIPGVDPAPLAEANWSPSDVAIALSTRLNGLAPWLSGIPSAAHVARVAQHLARHPSDVAHLLSSLAPSMGIELDGMVTSREPLTQEQLALVRRDIALRENWVTTLNKRQFIEASASTGRAPRELLDAIRPLVPTFGLDVAVDPDELPTRELDEIDLALLSVDADGRPEWRKKVSADHVLRVAARLTLAPRDVARRLHELHGLVRIQGSARDLDSFPTEPLNQLQAAMFGGARDKRFRRVIPPGKILHDSLSTGQAISAVVDEYRRFAALLGLRIAVPHGSEVPERVADTLDCVIASVHADGSHPWWSNDAPTRHLRTVGWVSGIPLDELIIRASELASVGLTVN